MRHRSKPKKNISSNDSTFERLKNYFNDFMKFWLPKLPQSILLQPRATAMSWDYTEHDYNHDYYYYYYHPWTYAETKGPDL